MSFANKKFQSPLGRARGLGSTHEGAHHWLMERITSAALVPLVFWLVYSIVQLRGKAYWDFTQWLSQPWNAALLVLFIAIGFLHAVMGLQVVIEDYVSCHCKKLLLIIGSKLVFAFMAIVSIFSILQIAL
ncbi:MAG: succinate dehydrogenase, hydrophobic membrane anchor protein [Micavibrio aeruginosavorus]|uniref:Succinate dehydrogenase hydrophobic membrane anchor subunit n=1 Tax=Micavibrio aeruginosavorus TaxID=349221 RepID=A0A2W5N492_9BACT|nr:MAG: succinate dehydrogenase, hydrophobic membrane anchor protein [Micavibrio aeruginosavorus]